MKDSIEIWAKPIMHGDWAICFVNRSKEIKKFDFVWISHIIVDDFFKRELNTTKDVFKILDLWTKKDLGTKSKKIDQAILSHDVLIVRLTKQ